MFVSRTDLFSRRFREGTSFPEVHPETAPLQALCCALLYRTQHFSRGKKGEKVPRKGEEEGWSVKGAKRKKGRVKTGQRMHYQNFRRFPSNSPFFSSGQ